MKKKKRRTVPVEGCHVASFTVEASFIVPMVVLIITMAIHIGFQLQTDTVEEAKKTPAVEHLEPVDEMYRKGTIT